MIRRIPRAQAEGRSAPLSHAPLPSGSTLHEAADDTRGPQRSALARALTLLLSEELRAAPEQIERVLTRELLRTRHAQELMVRLHPEDLALLQSSEHYERALELSGKLSFVPDPALSRGGCTLSSNLGEVDAQLETRLALVLALLDQGALV